MGGAIICTAAALASDRKVSALLGNVVRARNQLEIVAGSCKFTDQSEAREMRKVVLS